MELVNVVCILLNMSMVIASCVKPNIVFIIADDMGWDDVSFHGSDQITTPNIDMLAYSGVALGRYYTHPSCSPSRAALLTGKYSHKTGMQGHPILMSEDRGIPTSETLLPEYLRRAGYATHLVGKWHVGSSRNEYLPTARGFDSHFGHRGGYIDYYEHSLQETFSPVGTVSGLTLYKNLTPAWDAEGYITDLYTNHTVSLIEEHNASKPLFLLVAHNAPHASMGSSLQAAPEDVRRFRHLEITPRRMYAAMVSSLDESVGKIVEALSNKGILDNTIIVFVSDNGGMTSGQFQNYASNYPLRGTKMSPFEGGVRVVGLLWSTSLNNSKHYWDGYMHIADWMPTLFRAAGLEIPPHIDGVDQWENINRNRPSSRTVIYDIDDYTGYGTVILGQYKLVAGNVIQNYSTYQGADLRSIIGKPPSHIEAILHSTVHKVFELHGRSIDIVKSIRVRDEMTVKCNPHLTLTCMPDKDTSCLYDILEDPCESKDLSKTNPELVASLKTLLQKEMAKRIPRKVPTYRDPLSTPSRFNYSWAPWLPDHSSLTKDVTYFVKRSLFQY